MEADRLGLRKRIAVIVDSNFLLLVAEGLVAPSMVLDALERSFQLVVPTVVVEELRRLSAEAPKHRVRRLARSALLLLERGVIEHSIVEAPPAGEVDDSILLLALSMRGEGIPVVVATSDRGLRRRLRTHGIPTVYLRESSRRLEVDWHTP